MAYKLEYENEKIDKEFSNLIRKKMNEKQFWQWISTWKDVEDLIETAEDWDIHTKKREIKEIKKLLKVI